MNLPAIYLFKGHRIFIHRTAKRINQIAWRTLEFSQTSNIEWTIFIGDDKWHGFVSASFLEKKNATNTAVAIAKWMNSLKFIMKRGIAVQIRLRRLVPKLQQMFKPLWYLISRYGIHRLQLTDYIIATLELTNWFLKSFSTDGSLF